MTDREAFEAWAKEKGIPFHWDAGTQEYSLVAWQAWQAATAAERERCAMVAWTHYTGACKKAGISPSTFTQFSCADAIRKGK